MKKLYKILLILFISFSTLAAKKILFIGDSLTEGYGVAKEKSYPIILKELLKSDHSIDIEVLNGSVSGSTTASSFSRFKWFLKGKPDILVLALGANDGLRGIDLKASKINLSKTIELAQENGIKVVLAGMYIPPNYGPKYTSEFKKMYLSLEKEYKLTLIPFLLDGVAANKDLNISDGIHPNENGHEVIAKNLVKYLRPLL
ncbi:arylesterase [Halobacteriovorax sp. HLS]|uniref:arylesterase n=1 Tax=Halobacteriovorax sp. HLS TaxID=2234000 RepID=UPI000FD8C303|nr:arylesterase [Halobacteriovorax sp. HLS]